MAQGDWTADEAAETEKAVNEMFAALSKPRQREFIGHLNDVLLFLGRAKRELSAAPNPDAE